MTVSTSGARGAQLPIGLAALAAWLALLPSDESHAADRCEPSFARIVSIQGTVEVQPADTAEWLPAQLDERLCIGDTMRIGELARAAVALANDSVLRFDQRTTLRLADEPESGRSLLDLLFGDVHFFSHRPRALEVDTPIANASTEGTEFLMRARPERTEVVILDGRVRLASPDGEVLLASGDAGVAVAGAAPRREIVARPRDAVAWTLYYPPILAPIAAPGAPPALPPGLQRAIGQVGEGDYAGALAALDAVPEAARDARYFTYRAGVLLNVGRVEGGEDAIERALALEPAAADAIAERAVIAVVQNRRPAALVDARRAVELGPDSAPARIALSYALQAGAELEAARDVLRAAAATTPEDPLVQARLAELELSFGALDAAEAAATRAVALAPGLARTQMVLGFAALTRIDIEQAQAAFTRAIELDSALPLARLGLGLAKIRQGHLEAGRRELEIAAALDPDASLLRSYLGKAYFEERRGPLDADQFRIAKELDPNDPTPWFYDAIRLQSENRPVEALRNLEKSIALNDNRAVYRSRLLLDSDRATRGTSLARIYDDLGFDQTAVTEATRSLSVDPTNSSAHRFLSDSYAELPRHEIARVSELLQSQLLQPININPVQPSLPISDLNVITSAGPAAAAFNEFHPLFERNGAQLTASGVAGTNNTFGDEVVLSALTDRLSFSVGQFFSTTDGFRANDDLENQVYDAYAQYAFGPKLNVQAEYRYRSTDQGDLVLNFDPDDFSRDDKRDVDQATYRLGARLSPLPEADVLLSYIHSDRNGNQNLVTTGPRIDEKNDEAGDQFEGQALFRRDAYSLIAGGGSYHVDVDQEFGFDFSPAPCLIPTGCEARSEFDRNQHNVYVYNHLALPAPVTWTLGFGYDWYEQRDLKIDKLSPKLGVQWDISDRLRLRAAAFETVKRDLIVGQTIEPTQIAGFNQFFDDLNGTKATRYGIGLDASLSAQLYAGLEASWRNLDTPSFQGDAVTTAKWDEELYRAYVYWAPLDQWAVNAEVVWDGFKSANEEPDVDTPADVDTFSVPVALRYFSGSGIFGQIGVTYVHQDVERRASSTLADGNDDFVLLDAALGYRLPRRRGILSLEGLNLLDSGFDYQDDNYRSNEPRTPRYLPERTILARLTLNF